MTDQLNNLQSELEACTEENVERIYDRWGLPLLIAFLVALMIAGMVI